VDREQAWEAYLEAKDEFNRIREEEEAQADEDYRKAMQPFSDAYFRPDPEAGRH